MSRRGDYRTYRIIARFTFPLFSLILNTRYVNVTLLYMLKQKIVDELKNAMKAKDEKAVSALRLLIAAIKNEEITVNARKEGLPDDATVAVIRRQIKQRMDSVTQFKAGGRDDLMQKEQDEIAILKKFMPAEMSEEEIRKKVHSIITSGVNTMGGVMGKIMTEVKGKADGNIVRK